MLNCVASVTVVDWQLLCRELKNAEYDGIAQAKLLLESGVRAQSRITRVQNIERGLSGHHGGCSLVRGDATGHPHCRPGQRSRSGWARYFEGANTTLAG
jgi:hypothetical protein